MTPAAAGRDGGKLWNANYNRVMITNFALFFSFYLVTPLFPLYLSEAFGAQKDTIGLVLSGYTLVALLTRPLSGFLVDSLPRRAVLLCFLLVYALFFGAYLAAGTLALFALARTLHGGPFGAVTVANSTMAIDVLPPARRNEGIGFYGISNNLASAAAPTVGIWVYHSTRSFDTLFLTAFVTAAAGFLVSLGLPKSRPAPGTAARARHRGPLDRFFLLRGWALAANLCFFGFCWGVMSNYLAIYGKERLGVSGGTGIFFLVLSAGLILSRLQGNKSLREGRLQSNALEGIALSTLGYTLFVAWPSMAAYYASALLIGLGNGHMWPAFQNMIVGIARHDERGTANSTILTSWDAGIGAGILLGGVVSERWGYSAAFWMTAAAHAAGLLVFVLFTGRRVAKAGEALRASSHT